MPKAERQTSLCHCLSAAADRQQWLAALQRVARAFGYSHVTLLKLRGGHGAFGSPTVLESDLPASVLNVMTRDRTLAECPVIQRGASSMLPQYWSLRDQDMSPVAFAETWASLGAIGVHSGLMVPVGGMNGNRHLVNFAGDCEALSQSSLNELCMIALHALEVYDTLCRGGVKGRSPLTKRQLDVVRWTAQGKTSVEIADLLSISEHTVNAYMNQAMRKLDCVNRTQLVAKTIRLRLID